MRDWGGGVGGGVFRRWVDINHGVEREEGRGKERVRKDKERVYLIWKSILDFSCVILLSY